MVKPTERELLIIVTNFGLPDSLSALISHLPQREPVGLRHVSSLSPNGILEMEQLCHITVKPGAVPVFNSHFLYGDVFLNNTTKNIRKEGPSVFDRGDQADSIPIYRVMKEGLPVLFILLTSNITRVRGSINYFDQ